jgi:hypothetical protein
MARFAYGASPPSRVQCVQSHARQSSQSSKSSPQQLSVTREPQGVSGITTSVHIQKEMQRTLASSASVDAWLPLSKAYQY